MATPKFVSSGASFSERMNKEEEFFSTPFLLSYSGLNKLLFSPALFYNHYVLKQRTDTKERSMIEGALIHCLFLNPESFDDQFVLSATDIPSDNPRALLEKLFDVYKNNKVEYPEDTREDLHQFNDEILMLLTEMNLYQSLKTDAQRLEKMLIEKHVSYWEYLKKSQGRIVIDHDTYQFATEVVEKLKSTPAVLDVMGFFEDPIKGVTKHNEIQLTMINGDYEFGLRGILDNLVIDPVAKEIRINDLKKSAKDLSSFKDSIEYYKYYLQGAMYHKLVEHVYLSRPEYSDYKITFRFVVVDPYMQIAPIRISDETMSTWRNVLDAKLAEADHHFKQRDFNLPYEFLINNEVVL